MTARRRIQWWLLLGILAAACAVAVVPRHGWNDDQGAVVPHDTFPADCSLCHLTGSWHELRKDFQYDHERQAGYALLGAHAQAQCLRCHNDRGPVQAFAVRGCSGCHVDPHQGQLGRECQSCHDQDTWTPKGQIEAHRRTRFPLVGAHAATACFRCHPGAQVANFQRADVQCLGCHTQDLARATNPDHVALGFDRDCERCHVPTSWRDAHFAHTTFPLTGRHATTRCDQCHAGGRYAGTPRDCVGCHQAQFNATTNPNHVTLSFPTNCESCHNTNGWRPARFDHTTFALTGRHTTATCAACHPGGRYQGTPRLCVGCHQTQYNNTTNPNHTTAGFNTTCESCHSTNAWQPSTFNHRFPIRSGNHAVACTVCHDQPSYQVFNCIGCHDHSQARMADKHRQVSGYSWQSSECYRCHPNGRQR